MVIVNLVKVSNKIKHQSPGGPGQFQKHSQIPDIIDICGAPHPTKHREIVKVDYISGHATNLTGFK